MTRFSWDSDWGNVSEENGSGTLERMYVGNMAHVDGTNPASGAYTYYLQDHLGSTRFVYDQSKDLVGEFEYTPYGGNYLDGGLTAAFVAGFGVLAISIHALAGSSTKSDLLYGVSSILGMFTVGFQIGGLGKLMWEKKEKNLPFLFSCLFFGVGVFFLVISGYIELM